MSINMSISGVNSAFAAMYPYTASRNGYKARKTSANGTDFLEQIQSTRMCC